MECSSRGTKTVSPDLLCSAASANTWYFSQAAEISSIGSLLSCSESLAQTVSSRCPHETPERAPEIFPLREFNSSSLTPAVKTCLGKVLEGSSRRSLRVRLASGIGCAPFPGDSLHRLHSRLGSAAATNVYARLDPDPLRLLDFVVYCSWLGDHRE